MLNIAKADNTVTLTADATTAQLIFGAAITTLLIKKGSPAHVKLYNELANAVRNRAPWPLDYVVVEPEEMLRRLDAPAEEVRPPLVGKTYWWHPESDCYFTLEDGAQHPAARGDADGALCIELSAEEYASRAPQPAGDLEDLF